MSRSGPPAAGTIFENARNISERKLCKNKGKCLFVSNLTVVRNLKVFERKLQFKKTL
jgi:hypothetical protein